jgi:predicted transposase/invertase (TIGR01784 family)
LKHRINPQIDCVFKALLGSNENKPILISFLNGILQWPVPIVEVDILNPHNEKEALTDKLSIVDIKARDEQARLYQIEIQLTTFPHLPERMLYTWCDFYGAQLQEGQDFRELKPVIAIWLLAENLFKQDHIHHHRFQMADIKNQTVLSNHGTIHVLELDKWQYHAHLSAEDQWLYFFRDAQHWDDLPAELDNPIMRKAMETLKRFSEKEKDYFTYQAQQNYLREESTRQGLLEEALQQKEAAEQREKAERQQKEAAVQREEAAMQQKETALKEQTRLRELLQKAGINPDDSH